VDISKFLPAVLNNLFKGESQSCKYLLGKQKEGLDSQVAMNSLMEMERVLPTELVNKNKMLGEDENLF
jgi:hypothetical protein